MPTPSRPDPEIDLSTVVTCDADLEQAVGSRPAAAMAKSLEVLDGHCDLLLGRSPFLVAGTATPSGSLQVFALGGSPGHAPPVGVSEVALGPLDGREVVDGAPIGLLVLVPGYGETLRVNGRLHLDGDGATMAVEEAFLHCAKAIIRSELWSAPAPAAEGGDGIAARLATSPFVVLASVDGEGRADVSPKGDPAGLVRVLDATTVAIADRPGNRRTDTLHNLVADPRVALLALCPGRAEVVELRGTARVCTDDALLASMRLRDRTPKAAILIDVEHREARHEPAIAAARLWDTAGHVADGEIPRAARIWADHVRQNTRPGVVAALGRRAISESVLAAGLAVDYRKNL